jgi:hypothetical protein
LRREPESTQLPIELTPGGRASFRLSSDEVLTLCEQQSIEAHSLRPWVQFTWGQKAQAPKKVYGTNRLRTGTRRRGWDANVQE